MDNSGERDQPRTIVLADDDGNVRSLLTRLLEGRGYRVLQAPEGIRALELLADQRQPVHLLITDVTMPGLSGPDLIRRGRDLRPGMPVICLSARVNDAELLEGIQYLPKPFSLADLIQRVDGLLAGPA